MNDELLELSKPLMKWLADNYNPHVKIIIDSTSAEVLEGQATARTDEFITD